MRFDTRELQKKLYIKRQEAEAAFVLLFKTYWDVLNLYIYIYIYANEDYIGFDDSNICSLGNCRRVLSAQKLNEETKSNTKSNNCIVYLNSLTSCMQSSKGYIIAWGEENIYIYMVRGENVRCTSCRGKRGGCLGHS